MTVCTQVISPGGLGALPEGRAPRRGWSSRVTRVCAQEEVRSGRRESLTPH